MTSLADPSAEPVRDPAATFEWRLALESLRRPYPLNLRTALPMAALIALVPFYIFIAELMPGRRLHAPEIALDRRVPLRPAYALVYGALYLFLILLPVLVVRQEELIRRTLWTYLAVWIAAYVFFFLYPTAAPRPARVAGSGFAVWGLRFLYEADPPYNCFPSLLHVAHSFVSAIASRRVHRGLGLAATGCAALVGISTLFTKQHYVLDVIAGFLLAAAAALVFLRGAPGAVPELDRRAAPALAVGVIAILALVAACFWIAYAVTGGT